MSNQFVFSNNAATTLTSAVSSGSTTLQVASGAAFPVPGAGQQFAIYMTDAATGLVHEVMYATANASNQFTVVRGQEGTSAVSWAIGDIAMHVVTGGAQASAIQSGPGASSDYSVAAMAALGIANSNQQNVLVSSLTVSSAEFGQLLRATLTGTTFTIPGTLGTGAASSPFISFKGYSDGTTVLAASGTTFGGGRYDGLSSITLEPNQILTISIAPAGALEVVGDTNAATFAFAAQNVSANTTWTIAANGYFYNVTATTTQTLPAPSAVPGMTVGFFAIAGVTATLSTPSGQFIGGNLSGTTLILLPGQFWLGQSDGSYWRTISASPPLLTSNVLVGIQVLTSSGDFTPAAGTNKILIEMCGGAGAGGGTPTVSTGQVAAAGGGGGGAYLLCWVTSGFSGASYSVGAGGTGFDDAAGGAGTETTFASLIAPGGHGGNAGTATSAAVVGPGATAGSAPTTTGASLVLLSLPATAGGAAIVVNAANTGALSGAGGNTPIGNGGASAGVAGSGPFTGSNGVAGNGYGAGGGGSTNGTADGVTHNGGAGAPGTIRVWEYS